MQELDIYWLSNRLPRFQEIKLNGEADFYGISHIIAAKLKKKSPPRSFATWIHGWLFPEKIIKPEQILFYEGIFKTHLVATHSQVEALKKFGIHNVESVGLPFTYLDDIEITRKEGSLLVMPPHSLPYTKHNWNQREYVNEICSLKPYFSTIVACLHSACISNGYWVKEFTDVGIPYIIGASVNDKNALVRMKSIFSSFDYMTTNTLGSHIVYASYCGCKVSFFGKYQQFTREDAEHDPYYIQHPELIELWLELTQESYIRAKLPHLFIHPQEAPIMTEWASKMLGIECRKSPEVIASLMGWSKIDQFSYHARLLGDYISKPESVNRILKRLTQK
jgi:hypothetical protein